jgi:hypothetical protein
MGNGDPGGTELVIPEKSLTELFMPEKSLTSS